MAGIVAISLRWHQHEGTDIQKCSNVACAHCIEHRCIAPWMLCCAEYMSSKLDLNEFVYKIRTGDTPAKVAALVSAETHRLITAEAVEQAAE